MDSEIIPGFKEISTGNRRVRMVMSKAYPNLFKVDGKTIQCEYEGVVRLCRRCNLPGHHANKCSTPQCARCDEWGHLRCKAACKRCGGERTTVRCKVKTYSSAAQRFSPLQAPDSAEGNAREQSALNQADTHKQGKRFSDSTKCSQGAGEGRGRVGLS